MEQIIRRKTVVLLNCLIYFLAFSLCGYSQRPIKSDRLISEAEKYLFVREKTGHNDGKEVEMFLASTGLGKGYAWCAAYQSFIHLESGLKAPRSARVVDWFQNPTWERKNNSYQPEGLTGMVAALYYPELKRYGHIVLIVGSDKNNYYTIEGNTNGYGSREGDGVYRKIRSKKSISALNDFCK